MPVGEAAPGWVHWVGPVHGHDRAQCVVNSATQHTAAPDPFHTFSVEVDSASARAGGTPRADAWQRGARTARHPHATGHGRVGAHMDVVTDLDQVVELDAVFDHGVFEGTAVNAGVGTDLDIVANAHCAQLLDLDPLPLMGGEAKTIGTDHNTRMHDATRTDGAVFTYRHAGFEHRCGPDHGTAFDIAGHGVASEANLLHVLRWRRDQLSDLLAQINATGYALTLGVHSRIDETIEIIEQAGAKVIVFVPIIAALESLASQIAKHFSVAVIHGQINKRARDEIFGAFKKQKDPRVLVAQPAAMSHGLTLTEADTIVWFAPVNSGEIYEQACARILRPGQKRNTLIVNIEGTPIERRIYERLQKKGNMQGVLLDMFQENRK